MPFYFSVRGFYPFYFGRVQTYKVEQVLGKSLVLSPVISVLFHIRSQLPFLFAGVF